MAKRILKEGVNECEKLNKLSFPAEVFYRRLISIADNAGTIKYDLPILRCDLYALKLEEVKESNVADWVNECLKVGLIEFKEADPKPLILLTEWFNHVYIKKHKSNL